MANIFDYLKWRGDLDFSASSLNSVDYLIFSQMSYLPFDGIVPGPHEKDENNNYAIRMDLALEILLERIHTGEQIFNFKEDPDFVSALITSNRFNKCQLFGFVNHIDPEKEIQFSAICVHTEDDNSIIIFRGTDSTFIGWKEDFNMAFKEIIPAQQLAKKYLEKMSIFIKEKISVCGHSKGGNLAVYASAFCNEKTKKQITEIYNFDGPGFHENIISSSEYSDIKTKIKTYIPQTSIVGMMLEHGSDYQVVKSFQSGFAQHILYTWEVLQKDIVRVNDIDSGSRFLDRTIKEWINSLNFEEREQFIDTLYQILCSSEIKTVHEMEQSWLIAIKKMIFNMGNIDEDKRKMTMKALAGLFKTAGKNINTLFKK